MYEGFVGNDKDKKRKAARKQLLVVQLTHMYTVGKHGAILLLELYKHSIPNDDLEQLKRSGLRLQT